MINREPHVERSAEPLYEPILEAIPLSLIDQPLDYILTDHFRMRSLCVSLKHYAHDGQVTRINAEAAIAFLDHDLPLHHEDEDCDLFPAVQRRAGPDDDLGGVFARLKEDHRLLGVMARSISDALAIGASGNIVWLDRQVREVIQAYTTIEHRHLAMENGIIMAIARIRLKPNDLKAISEGMKLRRGLHL